MSRSDNGDGRKVRVLILSAEGARGAGPPDPVPDPRRLPQAAQQPVLLDVRDRVQRVRPLPARARGRQARARRVRRPPAAETHQEPRSRHRRVDPPRRHEHHRALPPQREAADPGSRHGQRLRGPSTVGTPWNRPAPRHPRVLSASRGEGRGRGERAGRAPARPAALLLSGGSCGGPAGSWPRRRRPDGADLWWRLGSREARARDSVGARARGIERRLHLRAERGDAGAAG